MCIKKIFLLIAILLGGSQIYAQNRFYDYDLDLLQFVASGQSSSISLEELAVAQNELAIRYANGSKGASKNSEKAAYWFQQGANNGDKYAQYNIAWRYYVGDGVKKDLTKAL